MTTRADRIVTGLPSPEVVLPRDHAQLLAALLTDLLNPRGPVRRGTRAPENRPQQQRRTA